MATLLPSNDPNLKGFTLTALIEILKQCNDPTAPYIYNTGNNLSAYENVKRSFAGYNMPSRRRSNDTVVTPNPNYRVGVYPSTSLSLFSNSNKKAVKGHDENQSTENGSTLSSFSTPSSGHEFNQIGSNQELTLKVLDALSKAGASAAITEDFRSRGSSD